MKIMLFSLYFVCIASFQLVLAQEVNSEWERYTTYEYLYSCQHDFNRRGVSETEFLNSLVRDARNELARQFEVGVKNTALLNKKAINGKSAISFSSLTEFSTDVTLRLCEVKTHYNNGEGYAIAYINRIDARGFYLREFEQALGKIDNAIANAETLIASGSKIKARDEELKPVMKQFDRAGDALAWLGFFDISESKLSSLMEQCYSREQAVKKQLLRLEHATAIYLQCDADLFGSQYPLTTEIRGKLNSIGCQYVADSERADWIVIASGTAEKFSEMPFTSYSGESKKMYVVDANVNLVIKNAVTGEIIYNDRVKAANKGKDSDITRAAGQAYSSVVLQIEKTLKEELSK